MAEERSEERRKFQPERSLEAEIEKLAVDGISCQVEGEMVVCSAEILKTQEEAIRIPVNIFNAEDVRKKFEEKQR